MELKLGEEQFLKKGKDTKNVLLQQQTFKSEEEKLRILGTRAVIDFFVAEFLYISNHQDNLTRNEISKARTMSGTQKALNKHLLKKK